MLSAVATFATTQPRMIPAMQDGLIHIEFQNPDGQECRGPVFLPFYGFVNLLEDYVGLTFVSPCGNVQVHLENLDDSTSINTYVAGTGSVMIPFSCSAGQWRITLTLSNGTVYVGEFYI